MPEPLIIAFDPGYDRLGWAIGRKTGNTWGNLVYGCIQTSPKKTLFARYKEIISQLKEILSKYQPTEAALESIFWSRNKTTALQVSEARGLVISLMLQAGMSIHQYTPLQIKQALTGYGRADKKAVEKMLRAELQIKEKLLDDTIDALAVLICHQSSRSLKRLS